MGWVANCPECGDRGCRVKEENDSDAIRYECFVCGYIGIQTEADDKPRKLREDR